MQKVETIDRDDPPESVSPKSFSNSAHHDRKGHSEVEKADSSCDIFVIYLNYYSKNICMTILTYKMAWEYIYHIRKCISIDKIA